MCLDSRISRWRLFGLWKPESEHFHVHSLHLSGAYRRSGQVIAVSLEDCGREVFFFFFFFFLNTRRAREVYLLWLRPQQLKPRDTERGSDNPISLEHLSLWLRFLVSRSSPWGTEIETGNLDSASWGDTWLTAKSQLWLELDHMVGTEFYRDHLMSLHLCNSSKCFPLYALKTFDTFDF